MAETTKKVLIGGVPVGGGEQVKIQSMCTTKTSDVEKTVAKSVETIEKCTAEKEKEILTV